MQERRSRVARGWRARGLETGREESGVGGGGGRGGGRGGGGGGKGGVNEGNAWDGCELEKGGKEN